MEKNEERVGTVLGMGANGEGVLKEDGQVVFVPFALVGEKIRYKVLKVTQKCVYGKLTEVYTPAENRIRPRCPVFGKCGGCRLQHVKYSCQLKIKEDNIANCFLKIAGESVKVESTVRGSEFRYRNKLQLPVGETQNGTVIGFYAENSHRIIPISDCPINAEWTETIISAFRYFMEKEGIKGYDEAKNEGDLREITVREVGGNLIITAVGTEENLKGANNLISVLKSRIKCDFSLYYNKNSSDTNVIYGDKFTLLYGEPSYTAVMLGIKYKVGVESFMQVNDAVCHKLYSAVRDEAKIGENTVVIDAYSGCGLMTAILSKNARKAIGIEIVKEAVDGANDLARLNNLDKKIRNYQGKCEDILPDIIASEKALGSDICLVLDPPRKGLDERVTRAVAESGIDRILYISCMPSTLARDIGLITGTLKYDGNAIVKSENIPRRYDIKLVRPFDMFAQTKHIETLVVLERKKD